MLNAFGRNYEEIGSSDKGLILKNSGKVKILWGKSLIDLLDNNGKLNVKVEKLIKSVLSEDNISEDGFYYVENTLALVAKTGENILNIALTSGMTFISFVEEQILKSDEKYTSLKNIGFIYPNILDVNDYPTNGIIYNELDQLLYIVKNKEILNKYYGSFPSTISNSLTIIKPLDSLSDGALIIKGNEESNSILFDSFKIYNDEYDSIIKITDNLIIRNETGEILRLSGNTLKVNNIESKGYKVTFNGNNYVLEVDSILSSGNVSYPEMLVPKIVNAKRNVILSIENFLIEENNYFKLAFKYPNEYLVGNKIKFYFDILLKKSNKILIFPVECTIPLVTASQFEDLEEALEILTSITNSNSILIDDFIYDAQFISEYIQDEELTQEEIDNLSFTLVILNQKNLKCFLVLPDNYSFNISDYIQYLEYLTNSLESNISNNNVDNILVPMKLFKALEARVSALEN